MLRDKLEALSFDDRYRTIFERFQTETERIISGAGDEDNWYTLWNQLRTIEEEYFGQ